MTPTGNGLQNLYAWCLLRLGYCELYLISSFHHLNPVCIEYEPKIYKLVCPSVLIEPLRNVNEIKTVI